ncbi:MAG: kelch repeat-containing protein [Pirellulales bacterium]
MPEAVASFGGVLSGDYIYVYSGHMGEAHAHSKKNLSQKFQRLNLQSAGEWENLPGGPGLQSVALVTDGKAVYRVGGLSAHNEPGQDADLESVTDFERFDPVAKTWTKLQALPAGRSSHDAIVADGKLYVLGGWNLGDDEVWYDHGLALDLAKADAKWEQLPKQPFQRRALAVAALDGKIYAIGGMTSENKPSTETDVLDTKTNTWSKGPNLPGQGMAGFGTSALAVDGKLYATTMDGNVCRLSDDGSKWDVVGKLQTPRFFHRILPGKDASLLIVAGASHMHGHLDSIERFPLSSKQ